MDVGRKWYRFTINSILTPIIKASAGTYEPICDYMSNDLLKLANIDEILVDHNNNI